MGTIYKGVWAAYAMVVAILWISGGLGSLALVILGMTFFGLVYFGMMLVLPHSITHSETEGKGERGPSNVRSLVERLGNAWNPNDTSMGRVSNVHHRQGPAPTKL